MHGLAIPNFDHIIKVSVQTFSRATKWKSEINTAVSDLSDNLRSFLRFYKNNYTVRTTQK